MVLLQELELGEEGTMPLLELATLVALEE